MTLPSRHETTRLAIADDTGVGAARRLARAWAEAMGFDDTRAGKLALIVTEAATNVLHHGGGGEVLLRRTHERGAEAVEMLGVDSGPGMRNVEQCMVDGYSTGGTRGAGLGGIARNADAFDIFSAPQRGAVVWARVGLTPAAPAAPVAGPVLGVVCVALRGEDVCGDGFAFDATPDRTRVLVMDGLGHGQGAADATHAGLRAFHHEAAGPGPAATLLSLHEAMRSTRGAAAALAEIEPGHKRLRFAGVGNCSGSVHDLAGARSQGLASHNGTLGAQLPRVTEFVHGWPDDGLLIMHTDGLATRWNLDDYPGLARRHPSVIAAVLYRDFARPRDDVTVLALRFSSA